MKHIDYALLDEFRTRGRCEVCGVFCAAREPHHLLARGMGGGGRMDIRENLIAVGSSLPFPECPCHRAIHDGHIAKDDLLQIVARREGLTAAAVQSRLFRLRRLPKGSPLPRWVKQRKG